MSGTALVVTVALVALLAIGAVTLLLVGQVRGLQTQVAALLRQLASAPVAVPMPAPAPDPAGGAESAGVDGAVDGRAEVVLRPTPLGPTEPDPDPGVIRVASVTLAGPLIKVVALSSGVRRALGEDSRMRMSYAFRKELRRQQRVRRKRAGWRP